MERGLVKHGGEELQLWALGGRAWGSGPLPFRDWETKAGIWTYLGDSGQRIRQAEDMERSGDQEAMGKLGGQEQGGRVLRGETQRPCQEGGAAKGEKMAARVQAGVLCPKPAAQPHLLCSSRAV